MFRLLKFRRRYNRDLHKNIFFLLILVLLWALALNIFEYHLPIFFDRVFGNAMIVGFLLSLTSVVSLLVDLPEGYLQNSVSRKRLIIISFALLSGAGIILFFLGHYFLAAAVGMLLYGAMYDLFDITVFSSIYMESQPNEEGTNLSLREIFENIGAFVGLLLVILYLINIKDLNLLVFSFLNLVALFLAVLLLKNLNIRQKLKGHKRTLMHFKKVFVRIIKSKTISLISILCFLDALWIGFFWAFSPIFMYKLISGTSFFGMTIGNEDVVGAIIMAIFIIPVVLFEYFTGDLGRKIKPRSVVVLGFFVTGCFTLIMGLFANSLLSIIVSTFFASVGMVIYGPTLDYLFDHWSRTVIGTDDLGEAVGVYEISANVGYIIGPLLGGVVIQYFSFSIALTIIGIVFICFALISAYSKLNIRYS